MNGACISNWRSVSVEERLNHWGNQSQSK